MDSASPVLGIKLINLLKVFENSPHEVKNDLLTFFHVWSKYDGLVNAREKLNECLTLLPTLKIRMNAFWDSVNEKYIISCIPNDHPVSDENIVIEIQDCDIIIDHPVSDEAIVIKVEVHDCDIIVDDSPSVFDIVTEVELKVEEKVRRTYQQSEADTIESIGMDEHRPMEEAPNKKKEKHFLKRFVFNLYDLRVRLQIK
ncbi:unnamed protein product [Chironomus riparius]|uniref:Uncharacterized protein n=1 Tax=Chironomus riparius TaxID=315576 RepID=A0A9N9RI87_9DIPT|nr:unnamed protein product [Chironomus riparius]